MQLNRNQPTRCLVDGVFDLFHVGHLNIIERANQNFDHCFIGLNDDAFVAQFKGKTPVIPYADRRRILQSIRYVDGVIPMDGEHCYTVDFLDQHNIDALVHGGHLSEYCKTLFAPLMDSGRYVEYDETPHIHSSRIVEICRQR